MSRPGVCWKRKDLYCEQRRQSGRETRECREAPFDGWSVGYRKLVSGTIYLLSFPLLIQDLLVCFDCLFLSLYDESKDCQGVKHQGEGTSRPS